MSTASRTAKLIADSAAADRARYRDRSRSARRTATGARPASAASPVRQNGASSRPPTMVAVMPPSVSSVAVPPLCPHPPDSTSKTGPVSSKMTPGRAERRAAFGGSGRPARAACTGIRAAARAGRRDASIEVRTARTIPAPITGQGRCSTPIRCPALISRCGR